MQLDVYKWFAALVGLIQFTKWVNKAFFVIFILLIFKHILKKNCMLQRDLNSDRWTLTTTTEGLCQFYFLFKSLRM